MGASATDRAATSGRSALRDGGLVLVVLLFDLLWSRQLWRLPGGFWSAASVGAVAATALLWRHRRPVAVFVVISVTTAVAAGFLGEQYLPILPLPMALYFLAAGSPLPTAVAGLGAATAPLALLVARRISVEERPTAVAGYVVLYGLPAVLSWVAGWRAGAHERQVVVLERQRDEAIEQERRRLARELHDSVSHAVSVMVLQAAGARAVFGDHPDQAAAALGHIEASGREAMGELRRMVGLLRAGDVVEPDVELHGLTEVGALVESVRNAGLNVELAVDGVAVRVDPSVDHTAYRIVQEALTNALKYGATDERVRVSIDWTTGLLVEVVNSGASEARPRDASLSSGYGLVGLHERVALVGGDFEAGAGHDHRFRVRARLPADIPTVVAP